MTTITIEDRLDSLEESVTGMQSAIDALYEDNETLRQELKEANDTIQALLSQLTTDDEDADAD